MPECSTIYRKLAPALVLAGLGPLALAPPAAHGQTADQPSVQRQLEELRHLIEQQQKTIGELQSRVQALQGQETEMHQSVQQDSEARHMRGISRERAVELMQALSRGDLDAIEREPWQPGY